MAARGKPWIRTRWLIAAEGGQAPRARSPQPGRLGKAVAYGCLLTAVLTVVGPRLLTPTALAHPPRLSEPLSFCIGLQGPGTAEIIRRLGLNALQYRLPLDAPRRLEEIRRDLAEASAAGLRIVLQLPTALGYEQQIRLGFKDYWRELEQYLRAVVPALKDTPGLAAWQMDDFVEKAVNFDDAELREFLADRYGSLDGLNAVWESSFRDWNQIGRAVALASDEKAPWGLGQASIDVADWQVAVQREILARWAAALRRWDDSHILMAGRISLYRTFLAVPSSYDVLMPAIRPDVFEDDPLTCNVHAVDMARRGGRFEVIPSLYIPLPPSPLYQEGVVREWVLEAASHGARGFALDDWRRLTTYRLVGQDTVVPLEEGRVGERVDFLGDLLRDLTPGVFGVRPNPCYAFLWTPYAGGLEAFNVPAYGYIEDWSEVQPTRLFVAFRRGCTWGTPDYLAPEDVPLVDLDRYSAVFAPQALSVPEPAQQALADWANKGGVLVADVGLGVSQTGSWHVLPDTLAAVLGLPELYSGGMLVGTWQVTRAHELLPDLKPGERPVGSVDAKQPQVAPATERRPTAVKGWGAYALAGPAVTAVGIVDVRPVPGRTGRGIAGVFAHPYGAGGGIFASFRLWERWEPGDPLFAAFHGSLCRRHARYALSGSFWPADVSMVPEVDGVALVSHQGAIVEVTALAADDALYSGAYCLASAEARLPDGRRSGDVSLLVEAPPRSLLRLRRQAVSVRPYIGSCLSRVRLVGPAALEILAYGADPVLQQRRQGVEVLQTAAVTVRVLVGNGTYRVEPGSRHRVTMTMARGASQSFEVTADAGGHLDFDVVAQKTTILVEPLAAIGAATG